MQKKSLFKEFSKGIIKENPVLCLVLGTCPTLAVTTQASNAIGMGVAATIVLICSNAAISLLRKVIPGKVRIPAYITIIAGFVTMVQMLVKAFAPALDESLAGHISPSYSCKLYNTRPSRDVREQKQRYPLYGGRPRHGSGLYRRNAAHGLYP